MKTWFFGILVVSALGIAGLCSGYPAPAVVSGLNEWTLEVQFDQPQQIDVRIPGSKGTKRYWYIVLTMTNNTNRDEVPFYPACDLMTDTFEITQAGSKIRQVVFEKIKRRHQGKFPFLELLDLADNKVLRGVDNTKDIAIIWPDFDKKAKEVTLFIAGLSNETAVIEHPLDKDSEGKPEKVYLRKTLVLKYAIGGDEKLREQAKLAYKAKNWVMR
jgi:hypothetical protein